MYHWKRGVGVTLVLLMLVGLLAGCNENGTQAGGSGGRIILNNLSRNDLLGEWYSGAARIWLNADGTLRAEYKEYTFYGDWSFENETVTVSGRSDLYGETQVLAYIHIATQNEVYVAFSGDFGGEFSFHRAKTLDSNGSLSAEEWALVGAWNATGAYGNSGTLTFSENGICTFSGQYDGGYYYWRVYNDELFWLDGNPDAFGDYCSTFRLTWESNSRVRMGSQYGDDIILEKVG